MAYADVLRKSWNGNRLHSVLVELTYRCNLDCHFCYNDLSLRGTPLSTDQYLSFFKDLADMGVLTLTLSGGEPLAHRDFFRIGAGAKALGFLVRIKSNGHALRGKLLQRLIEQVDPFIVEVSLHGARAKTHDRQTRVPGSFERLVANVRGMRAAGLRVQMNGTLTCWNESEAEAMHALAEELGTVLKMDSQVTPRDDGDTEPLALRASQEGLRKLMALQADRLAAMPAKTAGQPARTTTPDKHCAAGSATIAVDPFGTVYPCVQWRRAAGNLHNQRIGEIWAGSKTLEAVREKTVAVRAVTMALGDTEGMMGFCPGLAEIKTGSATTVYPEAELRLALRRKAQQMSDNGSTSE